MTTVRSFNDEVKALEEYGHDCCARIDDKIHECCERIKDAYSNDVVAYQTALSRMEQQEILTTYDVLGNERHKTALALKDCVFTYTKVEDNLEVLLVDGFGIRGSACYQEAFERLRDRLIYLLVGDQNSVKLSLKEDSDGVDTGRCGEAYVSSPDAPAAECDDDCVHHQDVQGLAPITTELRDYMEAYKPIETETSMEVARIGTLGYQGVIERCDAIDAIHAQLERDYQVACDVNERQDMQYAQLKAERDSLAAALDRDDNKYPLWAPESHYMLLPKDADGVPIHVGDVMEWCAASGDWPERKVDGVGEGMFATYDPTIGRTVWFDASDYRHHKPDTWEQIIEDALDGYHDTDFDALVARCKALAGDADE